jgi:hypothetical protein
LPELNLLFDRLDKAGISTSSFKLDLEKIKNEMEFPTLDQTRARVIFLLLRLLFELTDSILTEPDSTLTELIQQSRERPNHPFYQLILNAVSILSLFDEKSDNSIDALLKSRYVLGSGWKDAIGRSLDTQDPAKSAQMNRLRLASGAYGSILRARDIRRKARVAIKCEFINPDSEQYFSELVKQIRLLGLANVYSHVHLVEHDQPFLHKIADKTLLCHPMEYVDGDLFGLIHGRNGQPPLAMDFDMAKNLMAQIIEGVGYVHGHGQRILDLTPHDIVYHRTASGYHLKIARAAWAQFTALRSESARLLGTRGYHAPEVEWNPEYGKPTLAADVFSVGMIFWEILTGNYPSEENLTDPVTNDRYKLTSLFIDHIKDPQTNWWVHPGQSDFDRAISDRLQLRAYARPFETFLLNMLQGDPEWRIPQEIGDDFLERLAEITPS